MERLPNGLQLKRQYLHAGNSSKKRRHGSPYITITRIMDKKGNVIGEGKAICAKGEEPSKVIGKAFADSRAIQSMYSTLSVE